MDTLAKSMAASSVPEVRIDPFGHDFTPASSLHDGRYLARTICGLSAELWIWDRECAVLSDSSGQALDGKVGDWPEVFISVCMACCGGCCMSYLYPDLAEMVYHRFPPN